MSFVYSCTREIHVPFLKSGPVLSSIYGSVNFKNIEKYTQVIVWLDVFKLEQNYFSLAVGINTNNK